jgi:hypothetical protein
LDFDKATDPGIIPDLTAIKVDEAEELDPAAKSHIRRKPQAVVALVGLLSGGRGLPARERVSCNHRACRFSGGLK